MRLLRWLLLLLPVGPLLALLLGSRPAETLPLFARKYSMPCTQCHLAYPRLNAFGMAFRQRGYRLEGAQGESPWEDANVPLSVVGDVGATFTQTDADTGGGARATFNTLNFNQNAYELHSAGTLAKELTFHADANFDGAAGPLGAGMCFLQVDDIVKDGALNVKAGIYDADVPYIASSRATTQQDYLTPVTFDGRGVELNGARTGWTYAAGLINSDRTQGKPTDKTLNNLENVYAWLMRDLHGQLVSARVFLDRQDPRKADASASLHTQADFSAYLNQPRWVLIPKYTYEHFADPDALTPEQIHSGMLEGTFLFGPGGRWVLTTRYELRHAEKTDLLPEIDQNQVTADLSYYMNPNAKVGFDWAHTGDNVGGPKVEQGQVFFKFAY